MGVDLLDLTFRLEKRFGISIGRADVARLESVALARRPDRRPSDLKAGELHEWVVSLCAAQGVSVPRSSWNRVRLCLAQTVGRPPQVIHRETLVVRDLGFS